MKEFSETTYSFLYLLLFSPILSFITFGILGLGSVTDYFEYFVLFYGIVFMFNNYSEMEFPAFFYFLFLYYVYTVIWGFFNGAVQDRGLFQVLINRDVTSIIFVTLIVCNTEFTEEFILKVTNIVKYTIIIAAVVSVIQTIDYSFLNAFSLYDFEIDFTGDKYLERRMSIFGYTNLNEIGLSFIPLLSLYIGYLTYESNKTISVYLFLGGLIAFLSNSRYVMIGFLILSFQALSKMEKKNLLKYAVILTVVGFFLIQALNLLGYNFSDWYNERLFKEGSIEETTRYGALINFIIFFPDAMFLGTGVHLTREIEFASNAIGSSQIHVGYLSHLLTYGLVGSFFLFGFWISVIRRFFLHAKLTAFWGAFFAFFTFLFAQATLVYYSIFFYGIIYAFVFDKYYLDKTNSTNVRIQS